MSPPMSLIYPPLSLNYQLVVFFIWSNHQRTGIESLPGYRGTQCGMGVSRAQHDMTLLVQMHLLYLGGKLQVFPQAKLVTRDQLCQYRVPINRIDANVFSYLVNEFDK